MAQRAGGRAKSAWRKEQRAWSGVKEVKIRNSKFMTTGRRHEGRGQRAENLILRFALYPMHYAFSIMHRALCALRMALRTIRFA
jgi:hypothetical protein